MRGAPLLLSFLLPWDAAFLFVTAGQEENSHTSFEDSRNLRPTEDTASARRMGFLVATDAHTTPSEMPLWTPGGAQTVESAPNIGDAAHRTSTPAGIAGTRGAQLGVQEPLSFYGNVHVADPMPVAEVPVWICPPAALYMSLVYSFFPLSGAIAWLSLLEPRVGLLLSQLRLSLLEPRVGLLLSQLRSAWEVCCLHCFMLLMLHLMGGPETTLLLIQQQHVLPPPEDSEKALDDTKQVSISTGMDWRGKADGRELPPSSQPEQASMQQKGETHESGTKFEPRTMAVRRLSQSAGNSSNSNSSSNGPTGHEESRRELNATRLFRRGLSAPNLLLSAFALQTAAAAPGAQIPAAPPQATATKEEQELVPDGVSQEAYQTATYSGSGYASASQQEAGRSDASQNASEVRHGMPGDAETPARIPPAAASAAASGLTGSTSPALLKSLKPPKCSCSTASAVAHQSRIRWTRARRAGCFSTKSCPSCNKTVICPRCCGESRLSGSECSSHGSNSLKNGSSSNPVSTDEPQAARSIWRRCRERLHRQRLKFGAPNCRRSSMPPFCPTVVALAPRSEEADRSPFEADALLPGCHVAPAAPAGPADAVASAASAASAPPAASAAAVGKLPELHFQHQLKPQRNSEPTGDGNSEKNPAPADKGPGADAIDVATAAVNASSSQDMAESLNLASPPAGVVVRRQQQDQNKLAAVNASSSQDMVESLNLASPPAGVVVRRQQQDQNKLQPQTAPQHQQRRRFLRLGAAEAGLSGQGAALPGSTCSTSLTSHGSSPAVLFTGKGRQTDAPSRDIHQKDTSLDLQLQSTRPSAACAMPADEEMDNKPGNTDRRIWFVPPLCCLAWNTKARAFSAWDLRMSYRCLLPFTVLKLLRVLLCYLLSTLMHFGEEGEDVSGAGVPTDASAAVGRGASNQHVLQRLLQLCCFFSLVLAMWGLAVVFVATRPLLKPFNIGWKFTCLKALVFFIQLLELAAEALQPISRAASSATDGAAAAATAAAQRVYVFTFLELVGSSFLLALPQQSKGMAAAAPTS
ncbi:hypothetical protein, conserved [Eimeria praecox]|uniref:Transmembrane protein n=1 Tax=Eimeria praecox TaxID=51316 RepID=U6G6Z0_9EIME|nr:hypothetical protein, conserved [Eimeria praecox]